MYVTDEKLAAYVDGELDEFEAAQVRRAIEADPALAEQEAALRSLKAVLSAHYDPVLTQPVPPALIEPIAAAAKVVDIGTARATRQRWFARPMIRYAVLPALAASLVLVIFVGHGGRGGAGDYASPQLAAALDGTLSSQTGRDGTKMLLSFRDQAGTACRAYAAPDSAGIACRDEKGWKVLKRAAATSRQNTQFEQAGSEDAAIMAAAQEMAAAGAMSPDEERAARAAGWRKQAP